MAAVAPGFGSVAAFDEQAGLGELSVDDSDAVLPFHCTAIADGSRAIEVGTRVRFEFAAGLSGHWEARQIEAIASI